MGAADGAPPAVGGRPTSVVTAISFHLLRAFADGVSGWPAAPPCAGAVRLPARNRATSTDPTMARYDLIGPSSSWGGPPARTRVAPEDSNQVHIFGDGNSPPGLTRSGWPGLTPTRSSRAACWSRRA